MESEIRAKLREAVAFGTEGLAHGEIVPPAQAAVSDSVMRQTTGEMLLMLAAEVDHLRTAVERLEAERAGS